MVVRDDLTSLVESIVGVVEGHLYRRLLETNPKPLGLATGRTMEPIYEVLVSRFHSWPTADLKRLV